MFFGILRQEAGLCLTLLDFGPCAACVISPAETGRDWLHLLKYNTYNNSFKSTFPQTHFLLFARYVYLFIYVYLFKCVNEDGQIVVSTVDL